MNLQSLTFAGRDLQPHAPRRNLLRFCNNFHSGPGNHCRCHLMQLVTTNANDSGRRLSKIAIGEVAVLLQTFQLPHINRFRGFSLAVRRDRQRLVPQQPNLTACLRQNHSPAFGLIVRERCQNPGRFYCDSLFCRGVCTACFRFCKRDFPVHAQLNQSSRFILQDDGPGGPAIFSGPHVSLTNRMPRGDRVESNVGRDRLRHRDSKCINPGILDLKTDLRGQTNNLRLHSYRRPHEPRDLCGTR